jgi:hypothetical protein
MRNRITCPLAAVAALSFALVGCGSESSSGGTSRAEFQEAALRHAECMRRNGIDMPDPKPGQGLVLDSRDVDPQRLRRAEERCRRHLADLPAPELSEEDQREFRDRALRHARCMREQGIDFPDPRFGPGGRVTVELEDDVPVDDPRFRAAEEKCRRHLGKVGAPPLGPASE